MRITKCQADAPGAGLRAHWLFILNRSCGPVLVALFLTLWPARAESPEDQYLRIYGVIEQADALAAKGETRQALAKYHEAFAALKSFQMDNRTWNTKLVSYRYKYLVQKLTDLSAPPAAPADTNAAVGQPKGKADSNSAAKSRSNASRSARQTKLLEAGAEPRKELRLHPKAGDTQSATMTINLAVETTIGEMPSQSIKVPAITIVSEATVKSVSDQGDITFEMVISKADLAAEAGTLPQLVEPIKAALDALKGLSGTGTASSRGLSKGMDFKLPADAAPHTRQIIDQMKEAFDNLVVPLPAEPVGVGARWQAGMPLKSQGATIDQSATYELASLEDERLVVKSAIAQSAANQTIQNAALPGLKLKLTKMTGKGTSTTSFDLAQLLPSERNLELHTEQAVTMDAGGQPQPLTVKTDLKLHSEAK